MKDDVGGAVLLLVSCDGADGAGCDRFGADWLPVAREDVPLDRGEAEFASYRGGRLLELMRSGRSIGPPRGRSRPRYWGLTS